MAGIDAVEGTVKSIIDRFFAVYIEDRLDDTEFIKNVKSIIEATEIFVKQNGELLSEPAVLTGTLYEYAKSKWMTNFIKDRPLEGESSEDGYYDYYFDYIFKSGVYPP